MRPGLSQQLSKVLPAIEEMSALNSQDGKLSAYLANEIFTASKETIKSSVP